MKTGLYCALIVSLCASSYPAAAQETEKLAAAVPTEVSEVVSGGTWSEGGTNGVYRAIVVATPSADGQQANIIVQMLSLEGAAAPKVVKSLLIKEVSEKKLANAFLAMDAETDNEMTLIVTAYGAGADQDTSMHVKFNGKGTYEILPTPGEDAPTESSPDKKK